MKLKSNIGEQIKVSGYKNTFIADQLDVNINTLSRWIHGKSMPSVVKLFELAKLLNCKVDDLYYWSDEDK